MSAKLPSVLVTQFRTSLPLAISAAHEGCYSGHLHPTCCASQRLQPNFLLQLFGLSARNWRQTPTPLLPTGSSCAGLQTPSYHPMVLASASLRLASAPLPADLSQVLYVGPTCTRIRDVFQFFRRGSSIITSRPKVRYHRLSFYRAYRLHLHDNLPITFFKSHCVGLHTIV